LPFLYFRQIYDKKTKYFLIFRLQNVTGHSKLPGGNGGCHCMQVKADTFSVKSFLGQEAGTNVSGGHKNNLQLKDTYLQVKDVHLQAGDLYL